MWRDIIIIFLTALVFMLAIAFYILYKNLNWYKLEKVNQLNEREKRIADCEKCKTDLAALKDTHSNIKDLVAKSTQ